MKITKSLIDGYQHIYALNGFSVSPKQNSLYKYMCFEPLVKAVDEKELIFVSPLKWRDPFERRFFQTEYRSRNFVLPQIACMCLTNRSTTNEEASWKMYVNSNDKALRITYNYKKICDILEQYAATDHCKIYIGKVIYDFDKREIESLHKPSSDDNYKTFFPQQFDIEHYLSLMLIKRKSFQFENEVRVFIVRDAGMSFDNGLLRIKGVDYKNNDLISQIMIAPYEPLPDNDTISKFRKKLNDTESEEYKKLLVEKIGCTVKQSQLYANCNPLVEI